MDHLNLKLIFILFLLFMMPNLSLGSEDYNVLLSDPLKDSSEIDEDEKIEEPVLITQSSRMDKVILDGKWTDDIEWKESTYNGWKFYDGNGIILRSAHQKDYIYFLVDFISDRTADTNTDRGMICLESDNEKKIIAKKNAYCFIATLSSNDSIVLQGGSPSAISGNFKKIFADNVVTVGTMSDHKDRYSPITHTSYEFKIPTELVGRSNEYGLYIAVYDFHNDKLYSWPRSIELENNFTIPSPSEWGVMISPDHTLPEFEFPIIISILSIIVIIVITRTKPYIFKINLY